MDEEKLGGGGDINAFVEDQDEEVEDDHSDDIEIDEISKDKVEFEDYVHWGLGWGLEIGDWASDIVDGDDDIPTNQ